MANNPAELTDDILVAYADDELPEDEIRRLTPLIEANVEASKKVEAFRKSAQQLRECFSVDTPGETPAHIAEKIRSMEGGRGSEDNVVSLSWYRRPLSLGLRSLSSGAGLQKIAASLFIGIFVGVGATSQFTDLNQDRAGNSTQLIVRGGSNSAPTEMDTLVLQSPVGTFTSGSTISTSEQYRIQVNVLNAQKVSLLYYEGNETPVALIDRKTVGPSKRIEFPEGSQNGIKISTDEPFVTFELRLESQGGIDRRYFVFGVE